jgi:2-methylisocitrate lyase-like PEP mutase family enzyme
MLTQAEKGRAFRALRARGAACGAFIIPNPWDAGTARLLAHVSAIAAATDLPVSADLENGFGDSPGTVAETIRMAAAAARSPPFAFTLKARAENYLAGPASQTRSGGCRLIRRRAPMYCTRRV